MSNNMTKQVIKDPRSSYEVYGYTTHPTSNKNKKEVILYGWDFNIVNKVCIINRCAIDSNLLNKHHKFIDEIHLEEISPMPRINLTFQGLELNNSCKGFDNTLLGRYELEDCTIKIKSMVFMPGRRVVCSLVETVFESSKYYEESCEKFIDEILEENE
jgi:hypothetical protein